MEFMSGNSNLTLVAAVTSPVAASPVPLVKTEAQASSQSQPPIEVATAIPDAPVNKQAVELAPNYRLVIEPGPSSGAFIYKTVNPETGEVVRQFPREDLIRMRQDPTYQAGTVADTRI